MPDWLQITFAVLAALAVFIVIFRGGAAFLKWFLGKPSVNFRANVESAAKGGSEIRVLVFIDNETADDVRVVGISVDEPWRILTDEKGAMYQDGNSNLWRTGNETKFAERPPFIAPPRTANQGFKFIVRPTADINSLKTVDFTLSVLIGSNPKPVKQKVTGLLP